MRTLQFLLATLLLIAIPLGVNAQDKFIKSDFIVRKNINLAMVDKDGKYNDSYDVQYTINVTYKDNIEPRFNIKKYINKIVVKKGNNE